MWLVCQWLRSTCHCRGHSFDPWFGKIPHAQGPLSSCTKITKPASPRARAQPQEKPHSPQLEKAPVQQQRPSATKRKRRPPKFPGSGAPCPSPDLRAPSLGRSPGHRPRLLDSEPCAAGPSTPSPDPLPVPRPLHQSPPAILSLYLYLLEPGFCLPCTCAHRHEQGRGHLPRPQPCPSISPSPSA